MSSFYKGIKKYSSKLSPNQPHLYCLEINSKRPNFISPGESENLITRQQYGFFSGRSTITQMLNYLNTCVEEIAEGNVIDIVYFDFSKAFDTVPRLRLQRKLKSYGIDGHVLCWIRAFLDNRSQVVKVNGRESNREPVISGIPQSSTS